jgi:N-acetylmuramoyl-L-alanine amidase
MDKYRTSPELMVESLGFREKFTILRKVIANTLNILMPVRNYGIPLLLLAITLLNSSSTPIRTENKVDVIVIDAGHGGKDPGTHGKNSKEKDICLKIALKLGKLIEANCKDVKVVYTRKSDTYLAYHERPVIANKHKADLFICIHANSNPNTKAHGTETYVMGLAKEEKNFEIAKRENSVMLLDENYKEKYEGFDPNSAESYILFSLTQSAFLESSLNFAGKVENQFKTQIKRPSRGVKQGPFWVLWSTAMPSVLIETGFLSNPTEEKYLLSSAGQDAIALGIYRAFKEYKSEVESIN